MKKLMIAASAAFIATVGFGIESANVVGYAGTALRFGSKGAGSCFVPVSGEAVINLQDLKVTGYEGDCYGSVSMQELDAYGRSIDGRKWYWYDAKDDGYYGWYNDAEECPTDITFAPGEGLYVDAPDATYSLQSSGQVPTFDIAVQLRFGSKHAVNPTPVTININDAVNGVWVSGYEGDSYGVVSMQKLDEYGRSIDGEKWYWYDAEGDGYYGWYNDAEETPVVNIAPGESVYVDAPDTTYFINFPGVAL